MPPSSRSPASSAALAGLIVLVVTLPLARGGVDWPVQLAASLVAALAAALSARRGTSPRPSPDGPRRGGTPLLVLALALVTAATALQLVPVPPALHRLLSPLAASLFDSQLRPIGLYPAALPLSLDPPATGRELAKAVAGLCAAAAAARLSASRTRQEVLLAALAVSGVAVAALGLGAAVAGLAPLLEPRITFVNPNHLAGFLNLTAFVALGFAFRARGRGRLLWLMAFAVAGGGVFLSLSRGGITAFFVGAAAFALLQIRRARLDENQHRFVRYAAVPVAVACALAVAVYLALDPVLAEMRTVRNAPSEAKLQMWPLALQLLRRSPLVGIGRGAFATVFPAFKVDPDSVTFTHVENEWLQAPIDLGLVGLLLVAAFAWTWLRAARSTDLSRPEIGALAGTAAIAAHCGVDFSLEILGAAVPFAVAMGALARPQAGLEVRPWVHRNAAVGAALLAVAGMALYRHHPTDDDAMRVARARSAGEAVALATATARWHPADGLPQAAAGVRLVQEGRCAEGLPWLTRAMAQNPTAPEPHRYAARCLAAANQDALAKREYRLALLMGDSRALSEAARRYPSLDDLLRIAPGSPDGLVALSSLLAVDRPADAEKVLRQAWDEFHEPRALAALASVTLSLGRSEEALALARELEQREPAQAAGYLVAASALSKLGKGEESRRELELGAARLPGSAQFLVPLAHAALGARRFAEAHRLAESIVAHSSGEVANKRLFVASVLRAEGRLGEAIQEARAARDASPSGAGSYLVLADLCQEAGRYDDAIAAVQSAAALPGTAPGAYESRLASLREARQAQQERWNRQQLLDAPARLHPER